MLQVEKVSGVSGDAFLLCAVREPVVSELWELGQEEVWEGEQALVSPGPHQVHTSQLKPSFMPLPCSQSIRGSLQPRRTGETPLMELPSPSLTSSSH